MKLTIDLEQFLDFASYDKLLPYVYVPITIAAEIQVVMKETTNDPICYIEPFNHLVACIYYPISSWYDEVDRRRQQEKIILEAKKNKSNVKLIHSNVELSQQLLKAAIEGNVAEVTRLSKLLDER